MSTVAVRFQVDGQPRPPDADSVSYTLYGQDGEPLAADVAVPVGPVATEVRIVTDPSTDARTLRIEKRTMVVSWKVAGVPYSQRIVYRLSAFLNHTVTPDQIRSYLGVDARDLKDAEIDLIEAFLAAEERFTPELLDVALAQGGIVEQRANDAILYLAALRVIPSLQLRVAQEERDGPIGFTRQVVRDFSALEAKTRELLAEAVATVSTVNAVETYNLMALSQPTDPITG
jgi:hypothetical protein